jgi:hypothetical protein
MKVKIICWQPWKTTTLFHEHVNMSMNGWTWVDEQEIIFKKIFWWCGQHIFGLFCHIWSNISLLGTIYCHVDMDEMKMDESNGGFVIKFFFKQNYQDEFIFYKCLALNLQLFHSLNIFLIKY